MNEEFKMWLIRMYYENCKERELHHDIPYDSVGSYYHKHRVWLKEQYNEQVGEK